MPESMQKTILITGSTDGIGLQTAKRLVSLGHHVILHGRNPSKLEKAQQELKASSNGRVSGFVADLSVFQDVENLAKSVATEFPSLDVLINNAGVFSTPHPITPDGLDVRFVVNTLAPYLLTRRLLPSLHKNGRVVNLSSAAQAPVDLRALAGQAKLPDGAAYAQSKLALTMWSHRLGLELGEEGPTLVAVNPGSFLGTKMVKEAYGMAGGDVNVGAEILCRASLDDEFASPTGRYFDNDSGRFAPPHVDALDDRKCREVVEEMERILSGFDMS